MGNRPLQANPPSAPTALPSTVDDGGAADHRRRWLLLGIILIAINLRPALAGVGPLIADIRADTGLSHAALGLLTSIPLLAFGAVSAFSGFATRRFGFGGALALALLLLAAGAGVLALLEALSLGGLLLDVGAALTIVWVGTLGLVLGGTFGLALPLLFLFAVLAGKPAAGVAAGRPGHVGPAH